MLTLIERLLITADTYLTIGKLVSLQKREVIIDLELVAVCYMSYKLY